MIQTKYNLSIMVYLLSIGSGLATTSDSFLLTGTIRGVPVTTRLVTDSGLVFSSCLSFPFVSLLDSISRTIRYMYTN